MMMCEGIDVVQRHGTPRANVGGGVIMGTKVLYRVV
jgi:hypothetical protein